MSGPFLTEAEFAARFHRAPRTVRRWRSEGSGPPFVRIGRQVVIAESDATEWATARKFTSNADEASRRPIAGGANGST